MFELTQLTQYRENNRLEAKQAKDGLPSSLHDAADRSQDTTVLDTMGKEVFDCESVKRYRIRMKNIRPGHVWEQLENEEFLYRLGALGRGQNGTIHPTAAGLLMFGHEYEIVKQFPLYFLDYTERMDEAMRWTDRIESSSGDWSGNLYDFYFRVYNNLAQILPVPFRMVNGTRIDDTPAHGAIREALANCLVNADYYAPGGVVIIKKINQITFSNPGEFRIPLDEAKSGGLSDPRNTTLLKMFTLINIGERAGSGIPNIYNVWKNLGWAEPAIIEQQNPCRVSFQVSIR